MIPRNKLAEFKRCADAQSPLPDRWIPWETLGIQRVILLEKEIWQLASDQELLDRIVTRFRDKGYVQVPGYRRFRYLRQTTGAVVVGREDGQDARIPFRKMLDGIAAARDNRSVFAKGPSSLREYDITHINSPIWALLHLVTTNEFDE